MCVAVLRHNALFLTPLFGRSSSTPHHTTILFRNYCFHTSHFLSIYPSVYPTLHPARTFDTTDISFQPWPSSRSTPSSSLRHCRPTASSTQFQAGPTKSGRIFPSSGMAAKARSTCSSYRAVPLDFSAPSRNCRRTSGTAARGM